MKDYRSIVSDQLSEEPHAWTKARNKQPQLIVRRTSGKPRMRLSRVLSDEARRMGWFVSGVLGFMAIGHWVLKYFWSL